MIKTLRWECLRRCGGSSQGHRAAGADGRRKAFQQLRCMPRWGRRDLQHWATAAGSFSSSSCATATHSPNMPLQRKQKLPSCEAGRQGDGKMKLWLRQAVVASSRQGRRHLVSKHLRHIRNPATMERGMDSLGSKWSWESAIRPTFRAILSPLPFRTALYAFHGIEIAGEK